MTTPAQRPGYRSIGNRPTNGNRLTRQVTEVTEVTDISGPPTGDRRAELTALLAQLAHVLTAEQTEPAAARTTRAMPERVLLTPEEAGEQLGVGRTTVYALMKSGDLESVQIGRLRRIPTGAIQDYAASLINHTRRLSA